MINHLIYILYINLLCCYVMLFVTTLSNEEAFLQDFQVVQKPQLQNYLKMLKMCFYYMVQIFNHIHIGDPLRKIIQTFICRLYGTRT